MKLKKLYSYKTKLQIWRLLLSEKNRLIIEDRDTEKKEVFFTCLQAETGKKIFSEYQFDEKFWLGIETIYKEIIYLHKFQKPDMPGHKTIIAFSIEEKKILWENDQYNFLFTKDEKVYVYRQQFDSREFYTLDYLTGELQENLGSDPVPINKMRETLNINSFRNYIFPEVLSEESFDSVSYSFIKTYINNEVTGRIECIKFNNLLFMNYHKKENFFLTNTFYALDISRKKLVLKEIINKKIKAVVPDSFFIKDNLLYILKERQLLLVYAITE